MNDLLNFCTWMKDRSDLELDVEEECIVPIIKFFLEDANQEVGKTAYSHLAVMINRGKISKREYLRLRLLKLKVLAFCELIRKFTVAALLTDRRLPNRITGEPLL